MRFATDDYRCPRCLGQLLDDQSSLHCDGCRSTFPVEDGIVDFRCGRKNYYFNPVPPDAMQRLTEDATRERWPETVRSFLQHVKLKSGWLDNIASDGRYAWKLMLDLNKDTVLLDLGCGLGNLASNLAPHVGKVYAMDLTMRRLEFSRKRFDLFNADDRINLVAGGDGRHLPFASESLDCVVLSGVLEWVGQGDTEPFDKGPKAARLTNMLRAHFGDRSARALQLAFLKEIRRVLKKDGQLYVAIENRLNWEYFTGRPDHHSGLKFGSLMPRIAANVYSIAASRTPYRTYTYSVPGYRRLLREAGFGDVDFLGLTRGYSFLNELLKADADIPRWQPHTPAGLAQRMKRNKYFVPAYGMIASNAPRPWSRLQDVVFGDMERRLQCPPLSTKSYLVTGKDKIVVFATAGQREVIVKLPCNETSAALEQENFALLQDLSATPAFKPLLPEPVLMGNIANVPYFVESRVPGKPLAAVLQSRGRASMLDRIAALLDTLSIRNQTKPLAGDLYERHVTRHVNEVGKVVNDPSLLARLTRFFRDRLYGVDMAVGVAHGDFGVNNVLCVDDTIAGVIDWEAGETAGLPVLDAINYLTSVNNLFETGSSVSRTIPMLASRQWPIPEETAFLEERYARCGLGPEHAEGLAYLKWLQSIAFRLKYRLAYNPDAIDKYVLQVVRGLPS